MLTNLPEFQDTEAKVLAAKASLEAITARQNRHLEAARVGRAKAALAAQNLVEETNALAKAQRELAEGLLGGQSTEELQARVLEHQTKADGFRHLHQLLTKESDQLDEEVRKCYPEAGRAEAILDAAEFAHLLVTYARTIAPAIPLAREIRAKAPRQGMSVELSGYLLDSRTPKVGHLSVADDGSLYFFMS